MPRRTLDEIRSDIVRLAGSCDGELRQRGLRLIQELDDHLRDGPPEAGDALPWFVQGDLSEAMTDLEDVAQRLRVIAATTGDQASQTFEERRGEILERVAKILTELDPEVASLQEQVGVACGYLEPWLPRDDEPTDPERCAEVRMAVEFHHLEAELVRTATELRQLRDLARDATVDAKDGPDPESAA